MRRKGVQAIGLAMAVGTAWSGALGGPLHPEWVAAEATWVAHFDAEAFFASTLGSGVLEFGGAMIAVELEEVRQEIGIDPLKDIFGLSAFGEGEDKSKVTIILEATPAIDGLLERAPEMGEGYRKFTDGASTIHAWKDDDEEWFAFVTNGAAPDRRLVLISHDLMLLRAGMLRLGAREGDVGSPALRDARPEPGSIVFFAASTLPGLEDEDGPVAALLHNARGMVAQMGEVGGKLRINVSFDTGDAEQANNVMMMAQGLMALGRMAAASKPDLKEALPIFNAVRFAVTGSAFSVSMEYESRKILSIVKADIEAEAMRNKGDGNDGDAHHKVKIRKKSQQPKE